MKTIQIWTIQIAQHRLAAKEGIHLLDSTAKSGVRAFAPLMNNVMLYKDGKMSELQYTDAYHRKMVESLRASPKEWIQLTKHEKVAVACYCKAGVFCHRHLFVKHHMVPYLQKEGYKVELMGELGKPELLPFPTDPIRPPRGVVTFFREDDLLSNFAPLGFTIKGVYFHSVEQFMMYVKAKYMDDHGTAEKILHAKTPFQCKLLGREVSPYNDKLWRSKRRMIVLRGCLQKAKEHPHVKEYLLSTGNAILVEANPKDRLWGAGLAKSDPRINDPSKWLGENLLGGIWEEIRRILQAEIVF